MTAILRLFLDLVLALVAPRAVLVAENILLRQQLIVVRRRVKRPRFRGFDRWLIAALAGCFRSLLGAVLLVKPETVIRWHRAGWRLLWRWQSRRQSGRRPIDADLRVLIRRMWRDNPTWGEDRIAGELATRHAMAVTRATALPCDLDRAPVYPVNNAQDGSRRDRDRRFPSAVKVGLDCAA